MFRLTPVIRDLLIINVLVFIADMVFGGDILVLHYPSSELFLPVQIATHFFMHANIPHLFFNMLALVIFGVQLEALWGPKKFLFFYFFTAIGAALLHFAFNYYEINTLEQAFSAFQGNPNYDTALNFWKQIGGKGKEILGVLLNDVADGKEEAIQNAKVLMQEILSIRINTGAVGASGAIFGVLVGSWLNFPEKEIYLLFIPFPLKNKYLIPFLIALEVYLGVNQFEFDNTAHFAHLGGALAGFLLILYWRKFGSRFD